LPETCVCDECNKCIDCIYGKCKGHHIPLINDCHNAKTFGYNVGFVNGYALGFNKGYDNGIYNQDNHDNQDNSYITPTPMEPVSPSVELKSKYNLVNSWEELVDTVDKDKDILLEKGKILYSTDMNPYSLTRQTSDYSHGWYKIPTTSNNNNCINTVYDICHTINTVSDTSGLEYADSKMCGGEEGGCDWFDPGQIVYFNCFANGLLALNPERPKKPLRSIEIGPGVSSSSFFINRNNPEAEVGLELESESKSENISLATCMPKGCFLSNPFKNNI